MKRKRRKNKNKNLLVIESSRDGVNLSDMKKDFAQVLKDSQIVDT